MTSGEFKQAASGRLRLVAIMAMAGTLALGLGGCGRKGPLDPPPGAAIAPAPAEQSQSAVPRVFGDGSQTESARTNAPQKRIPLDALLE